MTRTSTLIQRIADAIAVYFSAGAVMSAIEARRRPDPDDMRRLGLDPSAFVGIGHG
jgi:hypothetical protein